MKAPAKISPAIERGRRNAELAAIHVGAKRLGFDDELYRAFLFSITGRRSAAELDQAQRQKVIELMRSRGFRKTAAAETQDRRTQDNRQAKLIRSLWKQLKYAGAIKDAGEAHLRAFVKRQTGVGAIEWLSIEQGISTIEALKAWCDRAVAKSQAAEQQ
ncbi:MAG: regulatory protein GemA [Candidatus Binatus sp.]|jgi:phage gp16-like protein|uniref:phage protein GemA/Gp16 family protein n=1 Tax=Candidatus Binatus sp. TaxID=2811406 RepID=UPI003C7935BB